MRDARFLRRLTDPTRNFISAGDADDLDGFVFRA